MSNIKTRVTKQDIGDLIKVNIPETNRGLFNGYMDNKRGNQAVITSNNNSIIAANNARTLQLATETYVAVNSADTKLDNAINTYETGMKMNEISVIKGNIEIETMKIDANIKVETLSIMQEQEKREKDAHDISIRERDEKIRRDNEIHDANKKKLKEELRILKQRRKEATISRKNLKHDRKVRIEEYEKEQRKGEF